MSWPVCTSGLHLRASGGGGLAFAPGARRVANRMRARSGVGRFGRAAVACGSGVGGVSQQRRLGVRRSCVEALSAAAFTFLPKSSACHAPRARTSSPLSFCHPPTTPSEGVPVRTRPSNGAPCTVAATAASAPPVPRCVHERDHGHAPARSCCGAARPRDVHRPAADGRFCTGECTQRGDAAGAEGRCRCGCSCTCGPGGVLNPALRGEGGIPPPPAGAFFNVANRRAEVRGKDYASPWLSSAESYSAVFLNKSRRSTMGAGFPTDPSPFTPLAFRWSQLPRSVGGDNS
eukprot:365456-Chlamydomonas_euryale.AAC.8